MQCIKTAALRTEKWLNLTWILASPSYLYQNTWLLDLTWTVLFNNGIAKIRSLVTKSATFEFHSCRLMVESNIDSNGLTYRVDSKRSFAATPVLRDNMTNVHISGVVLLSATINAYGHDETETQNPGYDGDMTSSHMLYSPQPLQAWPFPLYSCQCVGCRLLSTQCLHCNVDSHAATDSWLCVIAERVVFVNVIGPHLPYNKTEANIVDRSTIFDWCTFPKKYHISSRNF